MLTDTSSRKKVKKMRPKIFQQKCLYQKMKLINKKMIFNFVRLLFQLRSFFSKH